MINVMLLLMGPVLIGFVLCILNIPNETAKRVVNICGYSLLGISLVVSIISLIFEISNPETSVIGSTVLLEDGNQVVILEEDYTQPGTKNVYDYMGIVYPDSVVLFNENEIKDKIFFKGEPSTKIKLIVELVVESK